jgi:RHS repeat-associated protein
LTDGSGSTGWTYDAFGRVILREQTTGSIDLDTAYSFNSYGQLASLTTPSGQVIGYSYDSSGRVTEISVNSSTLISQIGYEPLGPTNGWTWGNSSTTTRTYDTDGQLVYLASAGESSTFTFYDDGRIATRTDSDPVSVAISTGSTTFSTSGTSNRLTSTTGLIARTYSYDATGNTLSDGTASFGHDDSGRMVSATVGASTTTYDHNGLGERVKKSDGSTMAYFAYDEVGHLIGEYDANGDLIQETVWFGDIPVATLQPDGQSGIDVYYVHTDHLNTPRKISRPSDDEILWRWDSDPFGQTPANEDPDNDTNDFSYNLRFPGQYFDEETGLHYNYFRDYDPATGRYVESDPIGLNGGINTYGYVGGNPLSYVDPYGLIDLKIPGATGQTSVHGNPGPDVTDFRPEHEPAHVHIGSNDGPRVRTDTFEPLTERDARRMTKEQKNFCRTLSDDQKNLIRARQLNVFRHGRAILTLLATPSIALDSLQAACKQDPFWCAENVPSVLDSFSR